MSDILKNMAAAYGSQSRANVNSLISAGQVIEFHNPRGIYGDPIIFPAFLTSFSDNVVAEFTEHTTYGRMDPIYSFQNTKRQIDFALDIPADDVNSAKANLQSIKRLQSLLYPTYASAGEHKIISTPPLFQIKFNNLIEDDTGANGRLLGVIPGISFNPEMEPGMFYEGNKFYPKLIKLSVTFKPLHSGKARGWSENGHEIAKGGFSDVGSYTASDGAGPMSMAADDGVPTEDKKVAQAQADKEILGTGWNRNT